LIAVIRTVRPQRFLFLLLLVFLVVQGAALLVRAPHLDGLFSPQFWANLGRVAQVMLITEDRHASAQTSFRTLGDEALRGMTERLDPYSSYMSGPEFERYSQPTRQSYGGIGAEVREEEGNVQITGLHPQGGARAGGLEEGDWIIAVDEQTVEGAGLPAVVRALRGEPGTEVEVAVRREGSEGLVRRTVERRELSIRSVRGARLLGDDIGYLRLNAFGVKTARELAVALDELREEGARAWILDLRDNPGGLLVSARQVLDLFLPRREELLTVRGKESEVLERFFTRSRPAVPEDEPIVILQNRFSASASEIVAGVLQAKDRAVVVGEPSHGKGSVQSVYPFGQGEGLSLTTAHYELPGGQRIDGEGVAPDYTIELSAEEIQKLALHGAHAGSFSERSFEENFGYAPPEDRPLELAIALLEDEERARTSDGETGPGTSATGREPLPLPDPS
jgi:carboxyl-terminal processing protease